MSLNWKVELEKRKALAEAQERAFAESIKRNKKEHKEACDAFRGRKSSDIKRR